MAYYRMKRRTAYRTKRRSKMRYVKRYPRSVRAETRRLDYAYDLESVVPTFSLLNGCGQGLQDYQRTGSEVMFRNIYARGSVDFPDSSNYVRLLLVVDSQPNAALPVIADMFTFPLAPLISYIAPKALNRFRILMDKSISGGSAGPVAKSITFSRKLNFKTRYLSGGNTIGDINTNSLLLLYITDSNVLESPQVKLAIRVTYTDS